MESRHKDYFEGILQLRNVRDEIIEFAINEIEKKENAFISKIKNVANGVDIYMTPQKFLRSLGNKLQNQFGGQLTVSKKLHTKSRLTSRELFRVSVLLRLPSFKKGDVIDFKGEKIKIISIHKKVFAKEVNTGKKLVLNVQDFIR